ncbi:hypothetical protein MMC07_008874, partial [Pseudocyphellaria aurata]|nr:hypothetical protein [Pseudocyphellaria aurata]
FHGVISSSRALVEWLNRSNTPLGGSYSGASRHWAQSNLGINPERGGALESMYHRLQSASDLEMIHVQALATSPADLRGACRIVTGPVAAIMEATWRGRPPQPSALMPIAYAPPWIFFGDHLKASMWSDGRFTVERVRDPGDQTERAKPWTWRDGPPQRVAMMDEARCQINQFNMTASPKRKWMQTSPGPMVWFTSFFLAPNENG